MTDPQVPGSSAADGAAPPFLGTMPKQPGGGGPQAGGRTKKFWGALSAVVAVVGAVTGLITVVLTLTKDTTNFSHLHVEAAPNSAAPREWAVAPEVLLEGSSQGAFSGEPCGTAELEWLDAHGEQINLHYDVSMRNAAKEGPMLALEDFRATPDTQASNPEDSPEESERPLLRVVCDPAGQPPSELSFARIRLDDPGSVAHFVHVRSEANAGGSAPLPVAFNLAPGESGTLPLDFSTGRRVVGAVQTTVISRGEERTQVIEGSEFSLPPLVDGGDTFLLTGSDGLACLRIAGDLLQTCDTQAVLEAAARDS